MYYNFYVLTLGKTGVPTAKEFKKECECLYAYALVSGVVEEEIELLINMLCKCNLCKYYFF